MEFQTFKITDRAGLKDEEHLTPSHIMQVGTGFWASKTLLVAVKFQLFTLLAEKPLAASVIKEKLHLNERSYDDFLDALVSLNFLKRNGHGDQAIYSNSPDSDLYLDKNKPSYVGGILEMSNNRLYKYWGDLEEALLTGKPQNEIKESTGANQFHDLYSDPEKMKEFLSAMAGIQMGPFTSFASRFDFSNYKTLCDAGGALGVLSIQVAKQNPHMKCINFDMKEVEPLAKSHISEKGMSSRVDVISGNFFHGIPRADVIVMGNILHDWNEKEKLFLIKNAYDSLPPGGAFVCIENIIDNDRSKNTFSLLMSLNMLIETKEGKNFTFNDFVKWTKKVGFSLQELMPLAGPTSAAIAYK